MRYTRTWYHSRHHDNLCVFLILVVLCYVLIHISTDASTLSTASGTFQPRFATGKAQSVTSHLTITSHCFQQRFRSNIHVTLQFTAFQPRFWMQIWTKPWFLLPYLHLKVHTVLWYLAADDVGGRFSGCMKRVLVATFWWNRSNLNVSSVSPTAPVYRHASAASPALDMSASVAFSCRKTSACVMKWLSERKWFRASSFPILNTRDRMEWVEKNVRSDLR